MTEEELRAEADRMGFYIVKKQGASLQGKCGNCKHLDMNEKLTIGFKCTNPDKVFHTKTAMWKYRHTPCCKLYEEKENERNND